MEQSKEQLAVTEGDKLKVSKEQRQLIEVFMGYADGYLSEWITWNDTMPVVEKINNTYIPNNEYPAGVIIYRTTCHINDDSSILVETTSKGSLIECVWQAVVEFIQWLNNQNPTQ